MMVREEDRREAFMAWEEDGGTERWVGKRIEGRRLWLGKRAGELAGTCQEEGVL